MSARIALRSWLVGGSMLAAGALADGSPQRVNWFDDPFFQFADAMTDCPLPAGPFITEAERRVESHHRAERGTTCWLAGQCDRPTAYGHDREIAQALQAALRERNPFSSATLWATVQGRIVFIEGCVPDERVANEIESYVMAVPQVQRAVAIVYTPPARTPPYKLRTAP